MSDYLIQGETLTAIGDAIRAKTGNTAQLTPAQMATEITGIQTGGGDDGSFKAVIEGTATNPTLPSDLTKIRSYAFYNCDNLALTSLPEGVTTIENYAFSGCTGITSMTFKGTPDTIYDNVFKGCANLTTINVPWAEGAVANAPWGATNATINYNYTEEA